MPSIVGFVKIISVGSSSIVQFGDSLQLSPSSTSKTYAGSGSFLTGSLANSNTGASATNTSDQDVQDSTENNVGNSGVGGVI
ncbi:spore germination protein [Paenibacillus oenotherae]|uniref:Spore germination protein n=1 Tax=Paenibacillus oenotherae TaxID=1435645 RepID=A0ABS7D413_9BACL|nr:spore germination protein [Paenibacillus oenotherae]MBW7474231.1 spore germination protein [Paenibacillus oenotherae]